MPEKVIILGSGPAGYTAAIYAARANLQPLLAEGQVPGGQLTTTTDVENYPGFPDGIQGPELMAVMKKQAERFGTRFVMGHCKRVDLRSRPIQIWVEDQPFQTHTLIIASGASAQYLGLESEQKLLGHGVSACATCDAFFFKGKQVVVVGGGDTAMEEATFLTKFASHVTVVHRRDSLRASKIMQERALKNPKISFVWDSTVVEVLEPAQRKVTAVRVQNLKSKAVSELKCDGLFLAIGHKPNTDFLNGQLPLDAKGYIPVREYVFTDIPGVFACGDVADHRYRQAVTAAGTGCMAAMEAEKYLESQEEAPSHVRAHQT